MVAVTELVDRLGMIRLLDAAIAALAALPAQRAAALSDQVTIDLDTTDVEV
jgi:hypothetical protein